MFLKRMLAASIAARDKLYCTLFFSSLLIFQRIPDTRSLFVLFGTA